MRGVNKAILVGNCGKDPELRYTRTGTAVTTLSVATTDYYERNGKNQETTTWHRVVCWGKLAEICEKFLYKGRQVFIEGRINNRSWTDDSGNKKNISEIVASQVVMLGSKQEQQASLEDQIWGDKPPEEF